MTDLASGDFVKASRDGQRMWWIVLSFDSSGIVGLLNNTPAVDVPLPCSFREGERELIQWGEVLDHISMRT